MQVLSPQPDYFPPQCRVFLLFLQLSSSRVRECTYESEIDRENKERIGRVSDREAGKECRFITLCHSLRGFTEGCYSLPFITKRSGYLIFTSMRQLEKGIITTPRNLERQWNGGNSYIYTGTTLKDFLYIPIVVSPLPWLLKPYAGLGDYKKKNIVVPTRIIHLASVLSRGFLWYIDSKCILPLFWDPTIANPWVNAKSCRQSRMLLDHKNCSPSIVS